MMRLLASVLLLTLPLSLTSCKSRAERVPAGALLLQGAGATFPNPLYQKWTRAFSVVHTDVAVYYDSVGSGEGIKRFLAGDVDFGASDRAMTDEQMGRVSGGVLLVPTCAGMVTLAYNPEGLPTTLRLKRDVYVDIFLGKITRWSDARIAADNPDFDFPDKRIFVVTRLDKSGTTFAFTNHLSVISAAWKLGPGVGSEVHFPCEPLRANGNEGVCGMIQRTPFSIGYAEFGQARRAGLGLAELENKAGKFVKPAQAHGLDALLATEAPETFREFLPDPEGAASYPIITYTWILAKRTYGDAKKADAVRRFLTYCLTDGQTRCEELGFVPLPPKLAARVTAEVAKIK